MTDDIINQAISESTPVETPQPIETPQTKEETKATDESAPSEPQEPDDVPFPKKAVNALSRRDKQIGKLQAERAALRAEIAKFQEQQTKAPVPAAENFENYGEFLKAEARKEWEQEQAAKSQKTEQEQASEFHTQWKTERESVAAEKAHEILTKAPDFQSLVAEYADVITNLPPYLENAFLELDNAPAALHVLMKEGRLESLLSMTPARAIMQLGMAEERGEALIKTKPITKTPAPLEGLKGTGNATKSLSAMSNDQLLEWVNSK